MSWDDIMRRVLPPAGGVSPDTTSPYGARANRPRGSTNPHRGVDFDYFGGQQAKPNRSHPVLHSPVAGVVENAGEGNVGGIAIRDADGFLHEILHTATPNAKRGDLVGVGQPIGTMGNAGTQDQHVHYQLKDPAGQIINPTEFWERLVGRLEFSAASRCHHGQRRCRSSNWSINPARPARKLVPPSGRYRAPESGSNRAARWTNRTFRQRPALIPETSASPIPCVTNPEASDFTVVQLHIVVRCFASPRNGGFKFPFLLNQTSP